MAALLLLSLVTFSYPKGGDSSPATNGIDQTITDKLHSIGGYITENAGQVANEQVRFYSSGDMQAGFAESAVLLKLVERGHSSPPHDFEERMRGPQVQRDDLPSSRGVMARITFPGSNGVTPQGVQEMPHRSNYFIGNDPSKWRTGVRSYREIVYSDLYDGIDLSYRMQDGQLKYDFIIGPGADPALIAVSYEGVEDLHIDPAGVLVVSTTLGELRDSNPIAYQDGRQVECAFVQRSPLSFAFGCEGRDSSRPLVIDPLVYSTFLGGSDNDYGFGIAIDSSGSAYVTGATWSTDFPATPGSFNTTLRGVGDAFVTKLDATGSALVYATFLGGGGSDGGRDIAIDSSGSAYVTGDTASLDFPATLGSFDTTYNGGFDSFVAKLDATGSALVYATFLGGAADDVGWDIAIDSSGSAYVTGMTWSADFPATPGSFDTTYNVGGDVFVARLSPPGSALVYATFLGGGGDDYGRGIAVDSAGNTYVTGETVSADFPVMPGSFDTTFSGGYVDAFVARLNAAGTALVYATFLGGSGNDYGRDIAIDSSGRAYVTGETTSADFPVTPGSFDAIHNGWLDAFVAKLDATGSALVYSSFMGGGRTDRGEDISVDSSGSIYVTGSTESADFPTTPGSFDTTYNGGFDPFVAKLDSAGIVLVYATFLGGGGHDYGYCITVDFSGSAYFAGYTGSTDFPVTLGAFDTTYDAGWDAFVTKLDIGSSANTPPEIASFTASPSPSFEGSAVFFEVSATDVDGDALTYYFDFESDGMFDVSGPNSTATHAYGDDFNGTATVRVSDGNLSAWANTTVIVYNLPPSIDTAITAEVTGNLTLRVAGEKWHDVNLTIYRAGVAVADASVTRFPGSPDDQAATIENVTIDMLGGNLSAVVRYTPDDDPVNGQPNGANPAWLIFTARDGSESRLHHTFNVRHNDTWTWRVDDLRALLAGMNLTFTATATDPGSDDLTFTWDWGDGTPATTTMHFNDGIGPDPYPSPGGTFPFTAMDVQTHVYTMAGMYSIMLKVTDDDGGIKEITLVMTLV